MQLQSWEENIPAKFRESPSKCSAALGAIFPNYGRNVIHYRVTKVAGDLGWVDFG